jgi:hypothetical protein
MPVTPPVIGPDLTQWGRQLNQFLARNIGRIITKSSGDNPSENGILLWDEDSGYPVVSKGGEFRQLVIADGYAFLTQDDDITVTAVDTAEAITFDAPTMSSGITQGTPASRITFSEGGIYLLAFSAQITSTSSSTVAFRFWPRINGTDVSSSSVVASLHQNAATMAVSRTAVFDVSDGDYLEVMWASDRTSGYLHATAATSYAPAAPSTSLSITRIRA